MDILITNGTVIDGTGAPGEKKDVLVSNGRIASIGRIRAEEASKDNLQLRIVDAAGKVVCPGFIDIHSHSDFSVPVDSSMQEKLRQGVTTAVIGNCGFSAAPAGPRFVGYLRRFTGGMFGSECSFDWNGMGEYLEYIKQRGMGANTVPQVGFANLRVIARGIRPGKPTQAQLERMKSLLSKSLDEGARGFSTGLFYPPQSMAEAGEIEQLVSVAAKHDAIYSTHVRNEMDDFENAVEEAIDTARRAGASLQISHHKSILPRNYGRVRRTMERIEQARSEGVRADTDVYPYNAFSNIVLPFIFKYEPGMEDNVLFLYMKHHKECEGKTVGEVMNEKKMGMRRLLVTLALREGISGMPIAGFMMSEEDVNFLVTHPLVSIGSDGVESFGRKAHPRLFGTFARVLEKYCREDRAMSLEEAVRKMTSLPAEKLGLKMRGVIREQYHADIAVFDPETVSEQTTYRDPVKFPTGFEAVIVNGRMAAYKDVLTGELAGDVL
mgnify:CR=1 FL=1